VAATSKQETLQSKQIFQCILLSVNLIWSTLLQNYPTESLLRILIKIHIVTSLSR